MSRWFSSADLKANAGVRTLQHVGVCSCGLGKKRLRVREGVKWDQRRTLVNRRLLYALRVGTETTALPTL